jgi:hypothetical protein
MAGFLFRLETADGSPAEPSTIERGVRQEAAGGPPPRPPRSRAHLTTPGGRESEQG